MVVWWSIFVYMLVISWLGMMSYKPKKDPIIGPVDDSSNVNYKSIGMFMAILSFALLIFFVGQRSWIFDTSEYQYAYNNYYTGDFSEITEILSGENDVKGPLFCIILIIFKGITHGSYNDWFTFIAIFQCVSLAYIFCKYSVNFSFSCFLFFSTSCFLWLVNGMRQFIAVTFVLLFIDKIRDKKFIQFLIVVLIAYFIHSSAIIWIPVYFIANFKFLSKKFIITTIIFVVLVFVLANSSLLGGTDYSYISDTVYKGVNPFRVIVMSVPAIIAIIKKDVIEGKLDSNMKMLLSFSIICSSLFIVSMFTNGFVARLAVYFQVFNYVTLPWLLDNAFDKNENKVIKILCVVCFILYFLYDMYIAGNGNYQSQNLRIF